MVLFRNTPAALAAVADWRDRLGAGYPEKLDGWWVDDQMVSRGCQLVPNSLQQPASSNPAAAWQSNAVVIVCGRDQRPFALIAAAGADVDA